MAVTLKSALVFAHAHSHALLIVGMLGLGWLWLKGHDADVRRQAQAGVEVKADEQKAKQLAAAAGQSTAASEASQQQARSLQAQQDALVRASEQLRQALVAMQAADKARSEKVATLPLEQIVAAVKAQLGQENVKAAQPGGGSALEVTEVGARKIDTCFVDLDGCRQESAKKDLLLADTTRELTVGQQIASAQEAAIKNLESAAAAKDDLLSTRKAEYETKVRAAQGVWATRAWNRVKFAVGVGLGLAAAYAAKK